MATEEKNKLGELPFNNIPILSSKYLKSDVVALWVH